MQQIEYSGNGPILGLKKSVLLEIFCLLFVILFLYAGASKLFEYPIFIEQLAQSPLFKPIAPALAIALPVLEIIIAIMIFTDRFRYIGIYIFTILMVLFTLYISILLLFTD